MKGEKLEKGQSLTSRNGAYHLTLQDDGNLVLSCQGQALWATGTNGRDVVRAEVQTDAKDVRLVLQDDRNLVLYGFDGPAWSSDTHTDEPPPPKEMYDKADAPEVELAAAESPAPAAPPPPSPPAPRTYTVVKDDTLWAIAERFYGDGNAYRRIAEASGVANPDLIHPGDVLTIPE
jgi:nucleoid-associated protein YgaU